MVTSLAERVKQSGDPALALELLGATTARSHVEAALTVLKRAALDDRARPALRERLNFYFANPEKDRGATLREALVRLLIGINHPDDLDLYLRAVAVYEGIPPTPKIDAAQMLRVAALVGISEVDPVLAQLHAVRLLSEVGDTSDFSGEPAATALTLLVRFERWQPIYQYVMLVHDYKPEYADVVSRALESLPADFPAALYTAAARRFIERGGAVEQTGIVGYVVEHHREDLYSLLELIVAATRSGDLHRYAVIQMAAARDPALNDMLFGLAKRCPVERAPNFIEALELVPGSDAVLKLLKSRRK
ncbi:MAG: hypothetical protein IT319_08750 [Anaerolineae bacterium]|nr:hypothetical protein [Anaerolineae bacterium]